MSIEGLVPEHVYGIYLGSDDPQLEECDKIKIPLKPHQRAALHKACVMEVQGKIYYNIRETPVVSHYSTRRMQSIRGQFYIQSNIGILGDIVGYGKTLTALSLIAKNPVSNIYQYRELYQSSHGRHTAHFVACSEREQDIDLLQRYINTTLAIVPRGPVYVQWESAIKNQTNLKALFIDNVISIRRQLPASDADFSTIKQFFEGYDIVLIKNTGLKNLMDHYNNPIHDEHPMNAWARIMVDEAHDIISKIPLFSYKFLWLISGTYNTILDRASYTRSMLSYSVRDVLNEERVYYSMVRGTREFVSQSFSIPEPIEKIYLCRLSRNLAAVQPFLSNNVQERLNAGDIHGAIREMGGTNETEEDIVELVSKEIQREIRNKECEINYIISIDIPQDQKEIRLNNLNNDLTRLREKMQSLIDRVTALDEKTCSICYDNFTSPILLPCTHVFCGNCLINWMRNGRVCPTCRHPIQSRHLIAIVSEKNEEVEIEEPVQEILSKEDTLIKLLEEKPDGKFLVFSRIDSGFWSLIQKLNEKRIQYGEMKGSTSQMVRTLERFKEGELKVILLNTYYAGSGIDISFATDVVIFHAMGTDRVQAIGRAQRQGRTSQLFIHTLCYPHEMDAS